MGPRGIFYFRGVCWFRSLVMWLVLFLLFALHACHRYVSCVKSSASMPLMSRTTDEPGARIAVTTLVV